MSDFPEVKDHLVANPDKYTMTTNPDGTVTLRPTWVDNPAEVLQEGTPVNAAFLAKIPEAIDAIDTKVTSQLADKASKAEVSTEVTNRVNAVATEKNERLAEIAVERNRINTFTALAAGSTTGDAELIDARVGADGRSYANLGASVRGQLAKLGNYLMPAITMTNDKNINLSAGVGNTVTLVPENVPSYRYAIVDCAEGDLFTINGAGGSSPRLWGFVSASNVLLSVAPVGADVSNDLLLVAPKNAAKLVINDAKSGRTSYKGHDLTKITRLDRNKLNDLVTQVATNTSTLGTLDGRLDVLEAASDAIDVLKNHVKGLEYKVRYLDGESPLTLEVQTNQQYNAWPFVSQAANKLVVVYSKGANHEDNVTPDVYRKISTDGGFSWSSEKVVVNTAGVRDTVTGKGRDASGNMLFWVRKGPPSNASTHHLFRTSDGETFAQIANPTFAVIPTHIGDMFNVPGIGLMAFYNSASTNSWGIIKSADNGVTWTQLSIEENLAKIDCPTEISGVYLGSGKIFAIGRKDHYIEGQPYIQFQIQSPDNGASWTKQNTNIGDISLSTPSLVYNAATDEISNYYFERGTGKLRLRKVLSASIWSNPTTWPSSTVIATGTTNAGDTGNANAYAFDGRHIVMFYSGDSSNTGIYATIV